MYALIVVATAGVLFGLGWMAGYWYGFDRGREESKQRGGS